MSRLILNQQLWQAACANDVAMVEAALVAGADPDFRDSPADPTADEACFSTHSVLHEAAYRGYDQVVSLLLRHGAEQCKDGTYGLTPLHLACLGGHVETAAALLARKGDIHATCDSGDGPLMVALMGENPYSQQVPWLHEKMDQPQRLIALIDLLLKAGADVNATNDVGETPLWNAIRYQSPEVLDYLIRKGADIHHRNKLDDDLIAESALALSLAEDWGAIPHRRKEGLNRRKRVLACLENMHGHGLQWHDVPQQDVLQHFPSEAIHNQLKALWMSMGRQSNNQGARATP